MTDFGVYTTPAGRVSIGPLFLPLTPAQARGLAKDLLVQAGHAEHIERCLRDAAKDGAA